jgi:hypothetical protein
MDLRHLREQARGAQMDAEGKRKQAARLMETAAAHIKDGDQGAAQVEQDQAAKLNEEATNLDTQAVGLMAAANDKEKEIQSIEEQQARLRAEFDQRMGELDKQKSNLMGSSTSLF